MNNKKTILAFALITVLLGCATDNRGSAVLAQTSGQKTSKDGNGPLITITGLDKFKSFTGSVEITSSTDINAEGTLIASTNTAFKYKEDSFTVELDYNANNN
jgi:hypothetical protein